MRALGRRDFVVAGLLGFLASPCVGAEPLPSDSVYHLPATWETAAGESVRLADLRGQWVVLAMFFSHCTTACPALVGDVKRLESQLGDRADEVRFVLASFDWERDEPERLRSFGENVGLDSSRWTLLHGNEEAVRDLAAVLGVRYRQREDGGFVHANVITLLDDDGRPVHRLEQLGADLGPLVDAIASGDS